MCSECGVECLLVVVIDNMGLGVKGLSGNRLLKGYVLFFVLFVVLECLLVVSLSVFLVLFRVVVVFLPFLLLGLDICWFLEYVVESKMAIVSVFSCVVGVG